MSNSCRSPTDGFALVTISHTHQKQATYPKFLVTILTINVQCDNETSDATTYQLEPILESVHATTGPVVDVSVQRACFCLPQLHARSRYRVEVPVQRQGQSSDFRGLVTTLGFGEK
ncbi:hypothetical protein HALLA_03280 (plasmid) [Halostagnicola larsenii XH-48]|uniref:Uncharacterized protein n=1 Tax=Halostagnicola larsenii XH-48 TaxID=797299 RepID=W0JWJ5_9EURY|nr:hypothetical protein HALLA_03280 [Halostagnicola larsenii XH-48]